MQSYSISLFLSYKKIMLITSLGIFTLFATILNYINI